MIREIREEDLAEIESWYQARGALPPPREFLPPTGLICAGIAAGYMIRTDAGIAFLEHFVANPNADKEVVEYSLDLIGASLIGICERIGIYRIYAITQSKRISSLAEKHNFKHIPKLEIWVRS